MIKYSYMCEQTLVHQDRASPSSQTSPILATQKSCFQLTSQANQIVNVVLAPALCLESPDLASLMPKLRRRHEARHPREPIRRQRSNHSKEWKCTVPSILQIHKPRHNNLPHLGRSQPFWSSQEHRHNIFRITIRH